MPNAISGTLSNTISGTLPGTLFDAMPDTLSFSPGRAPKAKVTVIVKHSNKVTGSAISMMRAAAAANLRFPALFISLWLLILWLLILFIGIRPFILFTMET
jgi:hypothetical protein